VAKHTKSELEKFAFKLGTLFKPTSPINREDLFSGRGRQTLDVVDVINQPGQHAVLYGERGVGKTSLANMIFPKLRTTAMPIIAPFVNCFNSDDFSAIWKRVLGEIKLQAQAKDLDLPKGIEAIIQEYTDPFMDRFQPEVIRTVLHELGQYYVVVVIVDEFDAVESKQTRRNVADTIKYLSDRNTPATIVMIGVADDVEELIENHQSIERCLCQINVPRMSRDELETIVTKGLGECEMEIAQGALHEISRLSRGLPHYTHLLGLYAGRCALENSEMKVTEEHVAIAVKQSIGKAQATIEGDYTRAVTSSRKDATYREVLLAAAMAKTDGMGFFYPKDVRPHLERIVKKPVRFDTFSKHLLAFCDDQRGSVLRKDRSTPRPRYRFANPLLEPYILIRGMADGLIGENDLRETRDVDDPQQRLF